MEINDEQNIVKTKKTTRTVARFLVPVHNNLRMRFGWYYRWHLIRGIDAIHFALLFLFIMGMAFTSFNILALRPQMTMAASGSVTLTTQAQWQAGTNSLTDTTSVPGSIKLIADARAYLTAAVVNNKIYAIGGYGATGYVQTNEEYDPATDTWTSKANMPTARGYLTSGVVNGKIYVIGGRDSGNTSVRTVEEYDPATDTWTSKANMPTARRDLTSGVVNGKIYAIGGTGAGGSDVRPTVEEYDPATDTWASKASMTTARVGLTSGVVNSKIYAIGGMGISGNYLQTNEEYDPVANTWTSKASMTTARVGLTSGVVNSKIYAIGGIGVPGYLQTNEEYDPVANTWTSKASMPTGRMELAAGVVNGKIYTIGGYNGSYLQTNEEYDPATNTWALKANHFLASAAHTSSSTQIDGTAAFLHWDTFVPDATIPTNTSVAFRFQTSTNGSTWSGWSASTPYAASIDLSGLTQQRYLQVETTLATTDGLDSPTLNSYTANYTTGTAPNAPTIGAPQALSTTSIRWTFTDNASDETGFKVYDGSNTLKATCATANLTYCDETGLSVNTQYSGRYVASYNGTGDSAHSGTATAIYTLANVPSAPTVNATSATSLTVIINVNSNPSNTTFAISCDNDSTFLNYTTNACEAIASDSNHWRTYANWGGASGFVDTGLAVNTNHTYKVKARNGDLVNTALSSGTAKYTLANAPNAPNVSGDYSVGSGYHEDLIIDTNGNPGGTNYWIQYSTDNITFSDPAGMAWQTGTTYTLVTLSANTQYWFKVKAKNGDNVDTAYSPAGSDVTPPAAPTSLNTSNVCSTTALTSWAAAVGANSYTFSYGTDTAGTNLGETAGITATNHNLSSLTNGLTYYWMVKSTSTANGTGGYATPVSFATSSCSAPIAPIDFAGSAISTTRIDWTWTDTATGETGWRVHDTAHTNISGDLPANTTGWSDTGLSVNTAYTRHANVYDINGSNDSNQATVYTLANIPGALTLSATSASSINITINKNSNPEGATRYAIYNQTLAKYVKQADGTTQNTEDWQLYADWGGASGFVNVGLDQNTSYVYEIKAENGDFIATAFSGTSSIFTLANVPSAPTVNATSTTSLTVIINQNSNPSSTEFAISCDSDTTFLNYTTNACEAIASDANHWRTYTNWGGASGFVNTGLSVNTQHTYKAKARNGDLVNTALSSGTAKYTLANVPSAPTVNTPTISSLKITINQNSNPAGTLFAIWNDTTSQYVQADGTLGVSAVWQDYTTWGGASGVVNTGLSSNTAYTYKVKAENGDAVETALSAGASASTLLNPPADPSNVTIGSLDTTLFTVSWQDNSTNETGFKVYISTTPNADCSLATYPGSPDYTSVANAVSQAVTGKSINTQYCAKVVATNADGDSGAAYSAPAYTLANVPSAPTVNATSTTSLTVIINPNSNPSSTEFAISCDSDTTFLNNTTNACEAIASDANHWRTYTNWGGAAGFVDTGLSVNTQHTYKVVARNGDNVNTALSSGTAKYTLANTPGAPTLAAISSISIKITINQNGNPLATRYVIYNDTLSKYVKQADGSTQTGPDWQYYADWGGASGFTNTGLTPSTAYTYSVKAENGDNVETAFSSQTIASTPAPIFDHLTVSPQTATVSVGGTQAFSATAFDDAGNQMSGAVISWSVSAGSIDSSGGFTAPATAGSVTVTASSTIGGITKSATATVTVAAAVAVNGCVLGNITSVSVDPAPFTLATGGTQTLGIIFKDANGNPVARNTVSNFKITPDYSSSYWSISYGGLLGSENKDTFNINFTAGGSQGTFDKVITFSACSGYLKAYATPTVNRQRTIMAVINPTSYAYRPNETKTYAATVTDDLMNNITTECSFSWSLSNSLAGTLSGQKGNTINYAAGTQSAEYNVTTVASCSGGSEATAVSPIAIIGSGGNWRLVNDSQTSYNVASGEQVMVRLIAYYQPEGGTTWYYTNDKITYTVSDPVAGSITGNRTDVPNIATFQAGTAGCYPFLIKGEVTEDGKTLYDFISVNVGSSDPNYVKFKPSLSASILEYPHLRKLTGDQNIILQRRDASGNFYSWYNWLYGGVGTSGYMNTTFVLNDARVGTVTPYYDSLRINTKDAAFGYYPKALTTITQFKGQTLVEDWDLFVDQNGRTMALSSAIPDSITVPPNSYFSGIWKGYTSNYGEFIPVGYNISSINSAVLEAGQNTGGSGFDPIFRSKGTTGTFPGAIVVRSIYDASKTKSITVIIDPEAAVDVCNFSPVNPDCPDCDHTTYGPSITSETPPPSWIAGLFDLLNWPKIAYYFALLLALLMALLAILPALTNLLSFVSLGGLIGNLYYRIANFFGLLLFGLRKRRYRGVVYDAASLEPVFDAKVLLIRVEQSMYFNIQDSNNNPSTKLIATVVTDLKGHFNLALAPGNYQLKVFKNGYNFPSTFINQREYNPIKNNYFGQTFEVKDYASEKDLDFNLPIDNHDPVVNRKVTKRIMRLNTLERVLIFFNIPLLSFGTIVSALAVLANPSIINYIILAVYIPLWLSGTSYYLKFNSWGKVVNQIDQKPLELALVRAYSANNQDTRYPSAGSGPLWGKKQTNDKFQISNVKSISNDETLQTLNFTNFKLGRLVRTVATNLAGRYSLRLGPGKYNLVASKTDYTIFKPRKLRILRGLDFINLVLNMIPKNFRLAKKVNFENHILGPKE